MDARPTGLVSDRFELADLLGSGGSASVFVALDTATGDRIALKVLHPHLSGSVAAREAFFVEARAVVALRHPNIVGVLDFGVHEGAGEPLAWIALELAPGLTLAEHVERFGALPWRDALAMADRVLRALEAAHAAGVVHRDVSPANVILGPGGDIRLVDFGLADAAGRPTLASDILRTVPEPPTNVLPVASADGADAADAEGAERRSAPVRGAPAPVLGVLGSANYMSPEQAQGLPVDERGDLYQVGALLHFALTAQPPFVRPTVTGVMRAHVSAPPAVPSVLRSGVPRGVDRLVVKALLKDPAQRFASAGAMRAEVVALAARRSPVAGPASPVAAAPSGDSSGRVAAVTVAAPSRAARPAAASPVGAAAGAAATVVGAAAPTALPAAAGAPPTPTALPAATGAPPTPVALSPLPPAGGTSVRGIVVAAVVLTATVVAVAWTLSLGAAPSSTNAAPQPASTSSVDPAAALTSASPGPETSAAPSPTPSAALSPPPVAVAPVTVAVPPVAGVDVSIAQGLITSAGLAVGTISPRDSPLPRGTVLSSAPDVSTAVQAGTRVDLVVASGSNAVPPVAGLTQQDAVSRLQAAGFAVAVTTRTQQGAPAGLALSSDPPESTVLTLGIVVTLTVAVAPQSTSTPVPTAPGSTVPPTTSATPIPRQP
ncbi:hypothetical protein B7R54_14780 [Subtercola boreus]|uniref:non-specific serine/threonine protein kinase n=1 Tax=Subtercola boreus TaxID=120213 RepID=A0A3E0VLM6_9MICO|nr:serine/threonine-protein kinase [Subtercola boreus]RFA10333.1 hypothetical protein B7R54_14780 [Subtercola boreus]TQL56159.1 serine/threonine-protein kinase [Subtercola boreus]